MSLILQDNTGTVLDANAYIDDVYLGSYLTDRALNNAAWTTDKKKAACIEASSYVDNKYAYTGQYTGGRFISSPKANGQSTEMPRVETQAYVNGSYILVGDITTRFKEAVAEYAIASLLGVLYEDNSSKSLIYERKKLDVLEKEVRYDPKARQQLKKNEHVRKGDSLMARTNLLTPMCMVL
jgi:hypothetical protein